MYQFLPLLRQSVLIIGVFFFGSIALQVQPSSAQGIAETKASLSQKQRYNNEKRRDAEKVLAEAHDVRLAQNMQISVKSMPIKELVKTLQKQSGISFRTSRSLPEIEVTIFVAHKSIKEVMVGLSEVLSLSWQAELLSDGSTGYLLFRSAKDARYEKSLIERGEQAFRNNMRRVIDAARIGDEALNALANDPRQGQYMRDVLNMPSRQTGAAFLSQLSAQQLNALLANEALLIPASGRLFSEQSRAVNQFIHANDTNGSSTATIDQTPLAFFHMERTEWNSPNPGINISIVWQDQSGQRRELRPISFTSLNEVYQEEYFPDYSDNEYDIAREERQVTRFAARNVDDWLEMVAETFHVPIIAESYPDSDSTRGFFCESGLKSIMTVLAPLTFDKYQRTWWKGNDFYLIRRKEWFFDRLSAIPTEQLAYTKQIIKSPDSSLEDWGPLTQLTPVQWTTLARLRLADPDLLAARQSILRFYASLSHPLRDVLFSQGIQLNQLSLEQRRFLLPLLSKSVGVGDVTVSVLVAAKINERGTEFRIERTEPKEMGKQQKPSSKDIPLFRHQLPLPQALSKRQTKP